MLTIEFLNTSGDRPVASITSREGERREIAHQVVAGHPRAEGWQALVQRFAAQIKLERFFQR
jgi:hypothetical protein